eukprot:Skav229579  [mRNA]  locus=scaffold568:844656:845797:+ [translate_table: standard]
MSSSLFGVLTWLGHKETFVENGRRSDDWSLEEHGFCLVEDMPMPVAEQDWLVCREHPVLFGYDADRPKLLTPEATEPAFGLDQWLGYSHVAAAAKKVIPEAEYVIISGHSTFSAELSPLRQVAFALRSCFLGALRHLGAEEAPPMGAMPDFIHADHTVEQGAHLLSMAATALKSDVDLVGRRVLSVNFWRNARAKARIQNHHMAVVDAQTISDDELQASKFTNYKMGALEQYHLTHLSSKHRLVYFPNMESSEILVFKQGAYDVSDQAVTPLAEAHKHHILHTAFLDPTAPRGTVPRKAICCPGVFVVLKQA